MSTKTTLMVLSSRCPGLTLGDVYETQQSQVLSDCLVIKDDSGATRPVHRSYFRPATLDDAFNVTHMLYGPAVARTVKTSAPPAPAPTPANPLADQVGGSHYKHYKIQPIEYAQANKLGPCEFNVVKYATRHKDKNGKQDLLKAIHMLQLLIQLEYPDAA